jgi:hypothetical protein
MNEPASSSKFYLNWRRYPDAVSPVQQSAYQRGLAG